MTIQKLIDAIEYEIALCHKTARRLRGLQERVRDAANGRANRGKGKCRDKTTKTS